MNDHFPELRPDFPLRDCPARQAGLAWPSPIHQRLDELVRIARTTRNTNRKGLSAALILAAPTAAADLAEIWDTYWAATAESALVGAEQLKDGNVLRLPRHGPGPR